MVEQVKYSIGLDIGTNSVGFSAVKEDGSLIRVKGKDVIGVRLFNGGNTAVTRRLFRSSRRRLLRRKNRITLLRELIGDDVLLKDAYFFDKLDKASFHNEDLDKVEKDNKFIKKYSKDYETIYHLRNKIINTDEKIDIRLVYLAIHNILKYRGHFLYESSIDVSGALSFEVNNLVSELLVFYDIEKGIDEYKDFSEQLYQTLNNSNARKEKQNALKKIFKGNFNEEYIKINEEIIKALLGFVVDFNILFSFKGENYKKKLSDDLDETEITIRAGENINIFESINSVYNSCILKDILLRDEEDEDNLNYTLSSAMIKKYNKHKEDLELLKKILKNYDKTDGGGNKHYNSFFRVNKKNYYKRNKSGTYYQYIKHNEVDEFYKQINKSIANFKSLCNNKEIDFEKVEREFNISKILKDMDEYNFLPKQKSTDNSAIPYQLHKQELELILDNQGKFHPILKENREKIISILTFKIPYYVGPLNFNPKDNKFAWMERKIVGKKIKPWNFSEIVDIDKSAENFINRMRNKCTYLVDEDTLPSNSLLLREFSLLNELNKIRINDNFISYDCKIDIIENLFKKYKTVSANKLKNYLIDEKNIDVCTISGFQDDNKFASSLSSYIDMKKIFDNRFEEVYKNNFNMLEEIIEWLTIFNETDIIKRKITNKKNNQEFDITDEEIAKVCKLKYTGWGRLSKKLIDGIYVNKDSMNQETVIDIMRRTNQNFMQVINSNKSFKEHIDSKNKKTYGDKIDIDDIYQLQGSPAIKKGIWQAILIINELTEIIGQPENIYIEFARSEDKKVRTSSRKKSLEKLYENLNSSNEYVNNIKSELSNMNKIDKDMFYLYFIQHGKCMYTGKSLNINELSQTCHIDHIIPRSLKKDDSLDNRVLVLSTANARKDDEPINKDIIKSQIGFWKMLKDQNFISKRKYDNLCKSNFTNVDVEKFVARQLVETRQMTKHLANILTNYYEANEKSTKVKIIRANVVSQFREEFNLYKIRELNNFHHGFDAYLTCIVGDFISKRFFNFEDEINYNSYNVTKKDFGLDLKKGALLTKLFQSDFEKGDIKWLNHSEIYQNMKKVYKYRRVLISKKVEEQSGEFYNQNLVNKHNEYKPTIPINKSKSDVNKYGGYYSPNIAYQVIISYNNVSKKKAVQELKIIWIPIHIASLITEINCDKMKEYVKDILEKEKIVAENIDIIQKIKKNQEILFDNTPYYISSYSKKGAELHNAKELTIVEDKYLRLLYCIYNPNAKHKENNKFVLLSEDFEILDYINLFDFLYNKIQNEYGHHINELEKIKHFLECMDYEQFSNSKENTGLLSKIIVEMLVIVNTTGANGRLATTFKNYVKKYELLDNAINRKLKCDNKEFDSYFAMYNIVANTINNECNDFTVNKDINDFINSENKRDSELVVKEVEGLLNRFIEKYNKDLKILFKKDLEKNIKLPSVERMGRISGKTINLNKNEVVFISKSVTGLFERRKKYEL